MNRPRGVSLVELLVALTACGVILTLSTGLIHRLMKAEMRTRVSLDAERTSLRLAGAFRLDVWHSVAAETSLPAASGLLVRLTANDGQQIEYAFTKNSIVRHVVNGSQWRSREEFPFSCPIQCEILREPPELLTLSITSANRTAGNHSSSTPSTDLSRHDPHAPRLAAQICARLKRAKSIVATHTAAEANP